MKRRFLTLGGVLLVAAMLAVWRFGYHGVDPRLIFWPPPGDLPSSAALDEPAELDVSEMPLADVLEQLAERYQTPIEVDSFVLAAGGLTGDEKVNLRLSGVPLKSLLAHVGRPHGLVVRARGGMVYLTTEDAWLNNQANYTARVYPLDNLLAGAHPFRESELLWVVFNCLTPDARRANGPSPVPKLARLGLGTCRVFPGGLVVSHTPEVQAQVARLLDVLAELSGGSCQLPNHPTDPLWIDPPSERELALYAALAQPAKSKEILGDIHAVVAQLAAEHQVPFVIDEEALQGWHPGTTTFGRITFHSQGSLDRSLQLYLKEFGLAYTVEDDVVLITRPDLSMRRLHVRAYPVADLLDPAHGIDHRALMDAAPGDTKYVVAGVLVAAQSYAEHEDLEEFLAEFRHALHPSREPSPNSRPTRNTPCSQIVTRCYRVPGWRNRQFDGALYWEQDSLIEVIRSLPRHNFGPNLERLGNVLVVTESPEAQADVADFLAKLKQLEHGPPRARPLWLGTESDDNDRVCEVLARPASVEFDQAQLSDVAESLAQEHQIPVRLELAKLGDNLPRSKITCRIRGLSLQQAMETMLREHGLALAVQDGTAWITVHIDQPLLKTRLYDVRDLVEASGNSLAAPLPELVAGVCAPEWDERQGAIRQVGGVLVAHQTVESHTQIARFLELLRSLPAEPADNQPLAVEAHSTSRRAEIEAALARRGSFDILEQPLEAALETLARDERLPLVLDRAAFVDELDQPVAYRNENATVGEALDGLLQQVKLVWRPCENALLVTSPGVPSRRGITRLYPIHDFLSRKPPDPTPSPETVMPHYYGRFASQRTEPKGLVREYPFQNLLDSCLAEFDDSQRRRCLWDFHGKYLVVTTKHFTLHQNIESALARLRAAAKSPLEIVPSDSVPDDQQRHLALFDLRPLLAQYPDLSAEELCDFVRECLAKESRTKDRDSAFNTSLPLPLQQWSSILVAACTRAEQVEIEAALAFLAKLPAGLPRPAEILNEPRPEALARLRNEIEWAGPQDIRRLSYAIWLGTGLRKPRPEAIEALVAWLARADANFDPAVLLRIRRALSDCGPAAAAAVPHIAMLMEDTNDDDYRTELALVLCRLGSPGVKALVQSAAVERMPARFRVLRELREPARRKTALQVLLTNLADPSGDRESMLYLIEQIDERGTVSRRLLDGWRAQANEERQREIDQIEQALEKKFGARRKRK